MSTFIKTLSYTSMKQPLHKREISTLALLRIYFHSLLDSVIFKNIPLLLDTSAWSNDDSANFGDKEINELFDHFNALLEKKAVMFKVLTKSGSF